MPVGVIDLHLHAPLGARTDALAELFAQRLAVLRGHMAVDVVAGRRLVGRQAVDVKTHVRPVHQTPPALVLPRTQPGQATGLLQLVVGITIFNRSDKQRMDVAYKIGMDPGFVKNTEQPRMEKVQASFALYKYAEIALLIAGMVLIVLFRTNTDKQFWYGLGIALAIQAAVSLCADVVAAKRGATYIDKLNEVIHK